MQDKVKRSSEQKEKQEDERGHQGQDGPFIWYE